MNRFQKTFWRYGLALSAGGIALLGLLGRDSLDKEAQKLENFYEHSVIRFEGNLSEYERWRGYECEILDPQISLGHVISRSKYRENLQSYYEKGIEAIVNYRSWSYYEWGLPVRKKRPK